MMGDTVSKNKNKGMEGEGKDAFALEMRRQEGLVARRSVRRDVVKETLAVMEERVADRQRDVLAIQGGNGNKKELLQDLVGDEMERVAERAARDSQEVKLIELLEAHVGEVFSAMIAGVASYGLFVRLDNTAEGLVEMGDLGREYFILDPVRHTLTGSDTGAMLRG